MAAALDLNVATYESTKPLQLRPRVAKVVRVYDGDTVWLAFEHASEIIRCSTRLLGVDTAEIRTKNDAEKTAALGARDELRTLILGKLVHVETEAAADKYGRLLATIWLQAEDPESTPSINQRLVDRWGLAYDGGRKKLDVDWSSVPRNGTAPLCDF